MVSRVCVRARVVRKIGRWRQSEGNAPKDTPRWVQARRRGSWDGG